MKKIIIVAVAMLAVAFSANAQIGFEANLGINVADLKIKDGDNYDARIGYHLGVRGSLDLSSVISGAYANAGAMFSLKGGRLGSEDQLKFNPFYLEVPVHFGFQASFGEVGLFAEAGPYVGFGLTGKEVVLGDNKVDIFDENTFKRFDLGVGGRAGVCIVEKYSAYIGYDLGFVNVSQDSHTKVHNTNLYFGVGYRF